MKKLLFVLAFFLSVFHANSQWYQKYGVTNINELSEEQLKFSLQKAEKNLKTGKILTITGLSVGLVSYTIALTGVKNMFEDNFEDNVDKMVNGTLFTVVGLGVTAVGIPFWIAGASRRNQIEVALVQFNQSSYVGNMNPATLGLKQPTTIGLGVKVSF